MSCLDKNRKRNCIINFRVSEQELKEINNKILLTGLPKSEYFISSVLTKSKTVYIGKFESDRLSLEFQKLKLYLQDFLKNNDNKEVKNRLKINSVIHNAQMYFKLCEKYGSLDEFLWSYVDNKPIINSWVKIEDVPASTKISDEISKQLKKEGFKFVGTTTIYALMQSIGMVNDHLLSCDFCNI